MDGVLWLLAAYRIAFVLAFDQSITDCKAFAAEFRSTCAHGDYDTPAASMEEMASTTTTCANKPACIPSGTVIGWSTCTWERKLCVTCREVDGSTLIRVQTNNLPDHCVTSTSIKAKNFDFEVGFNPKEQYGEWEKTLRSQYQLNSAVCRISKDYDAAAFGIVEYGDDESANAMGIALNGVAFQFANTLQEDPVYPITLANEQPLDICLGHNQLNSDSGMYHYHDISPCINPDFMTGKTIAACQDTPDCAQSITDWALSGFASMQTKTVIGIGKDGHALFGPYDESGQLWIAGDVDACNGAWSSDQSEYFYVSTRWHPYLVGCLGPSNFPQNQDPQLYAQCSLNGMEQYANLVAPTSPPSPAPSIPHAVPLLASQQSIGATEDKSVVIGVSVAAALLCAGVAILGLLHWQRRKVRQKSAMQQQANPGAEEPTISHNAQLEAST